MNMFFLILVCDLWAYIVCGDLIQRHATWQIIYFTFYLINNLETHCDEQTGGGGEVLWFHYNSQIIYTVYLIFVNFALFRLQ